MKIELLDGEREIGTWTVMYFSPAGGKFNGKLVVTNKRLLYDAMFDMSVKGLIDETLFIKFGSEDFFVIPKNRIKNIESKKSFFAKKMMLTLDTGEVHTFSYGMLNIDKLVEAVTD